MAPGPPNLEANRFSILDTVPTKKRKSGSRAVPFPTLPEVNIEDPKYITIEAKDVTKPLSSYSCFAVHRSIHVISKEILSMTQLRDGKMLLLVKNKTIANKFIISKTLPGLCDITAKFHDQLNFVKGSIYAPFLNNVSENEIVQELSSAGVVEAFKFKRQVEGKEVCSGVVLLTFDMFNIPSNISVAWTKVRVQQFFPTPMRCKSCQYLGHTAKYCKRTPACVTCALPPHSPTACPRIMCANCSESHPADSKTCTKFQQAKEILKIKTLNKCSIGEASKIYKSKLPSIPPNASTFAEVLKNSNNNQSENPNTNPLPNKKNATCLNSKPVLVKDPQHSIKPLANNSINIKNTSNSSDSEPSKSKPLPINSNLHTSSHTNNSTHNSPSSSPVFFQELDIPHSTPNSPVLNKKSVYSPLPALSNVLSASQENTTDYGDMSS